ncbi:hypothetical protein PPL_03170 [Heterostelium album PN500]|uniref:C3H1-type domain-containing protein n=1 Tax=Heterostelium pallidum (strain ATCC 26659 / Pp 5 / PN500) TaxID=670386 RepID=D3B449_HETP5|nr:hypothetical protein PPL_03170 [Heterostelium album PN500]EFA84097.1 hypothetical protein PPL_03170 [Heterostelium album PN500]|eukprot:XP_020436214.1 hypothetical protein PPL_03170 [Heterostelium album PN500]
MNKISIEECYKSINGYTLSSDLNLNILKIDEEQFNQSFSRNEYFFTPFEQLFNRKLPSYLDNDYHNTLDSNSNHNETETSRITLNSITTFTTTTPATATTNTTTKKTKSPKKTATTTLDKKQREQNETNQTKEDHGKKSTSDATLPNSFENPSLALVKPSDVQKSKSKSAARTAILLDSSSLPPSVAPSITKKQQPQQQQQPLQQEQTTPTNNEHASLSPSTVSPVVKPTVAIRKLPSIRNSKLNPLDISSSKSIQSLQKIAAKSSENDNAIEYQPPPTIQKPTPNQPAVNPLSSSSAFPHLHQSIVKRPNLYHSIDDEVEKLMNLIFNRKVVQIHSLPRYYKLIQSIDISTMIPHASDPILMHRGTVLQLGKCPVFEKIPLNSEVPLSNYYPSPDEPTISSTFWTKSTIPTLSKDTNIQSLVEKNNIDIVLSSSSFVKLINNVAPFSEDWEIPITSRDYVNATGENKKVYILDKPLLKKSITPKEKNEKYFNLAVESIGLTRGEQSNYPPIHFSTDEDTTKQKHLTSTNLTYNVWRFGEMKLLIRCKIHGLVPDPSSKLKVRYIGIKTKLEYQAERGLEDASVSDTAKWWSYTYIRPDAHLIFARVNVWNRKLLALEKKDMTHILHPKCQFNPSKSSKITMELLKHIKNLSGGDRFLMVHKSLENFVHIHQQTETNQTENPNDIIYDLHQLHQGLPIVNHDVQPVTLIPLPAPPQPPAPIIKNQASTNNSDIKVCFSFANNGQCSNPNNCNFSHLTMAQVKERNLEHQLNPSKKRKASQQKKKKEKKSKKQQASTSDGEHDSGPADSMDSTSDLSYINSLLS